MSFSRHLSEVLRILRFYLHSYAAAGSQGMALKSRPSLAPAIRSHKRRDYPGPRTASKMKQTVKREACLLYLYVSQSRLHPRAAPWSTKHSGSKYERGAFENDRPFEVSGKNLPPMTSTRNRLKRFTYYQVRAIYMAYICCSKEKCE